MGHFADPVLKKRVERLPIAWSMNIDGEGHSRPTEWRRELARIV
jgi:hypothetical protein